MKTDATLADIAVLEARRLELPEVSVEVVPLRSYPLASAAAHALGRVGEISERQLQLPEFKGLPPGALVGQAGIESRYNRELMGQDGFRRVVVNSRGLEVAEAARQPPSDGPNLTLSIDASLQAAMETRLRGTLGLRRGARPRDGRDPGHDLDAGLRPEPLHDRDRPGRVGEPRERPRDAAHEPRDPGLLRARAARSR